MWGVCEAETTWEVCSETGGLRWRRGAGASAGARGEAGGAGWARTTGGPFPPTKDKVLKSDQNDPNVKNPMDRGAWRATVHGVAKIRT